MHFGLSPETEAIISIAIYAVIIGAILIVPYLAMDYIKGIYRTKPIFAAMRESRHNWPAIIALILIWGVPIGIVLIGKMVR